MNKVTHEFVQLFNEKRDFYECHEIFEEAWKAAVDPVEASFYKALVQVATAQFKLNKGLLRGVRKLYGFCREPLAALPDLYQGIDLCRLRREFASQVHSLPADLDVIAEGEYQLYGLSYLDIYRAE